jgi:hypothetical protein
MEYQTTVLKTLDLSNGTLVPFSSTRGERVRVLSGRVWLTEEGDLHDALLTDGQEIALGGRGLAVIEALSPACVQVLQSQSVWNLARSCVGRVARRITELWLRPSRHPHAARSKERALAQALAQFDGSLGLVQRVKVQAGCAGGNQALA